MEKKMKKPEIEEIKLDRADVIMTSGPMTNGGDNKEDGYNEGSGFPEL